ncbi:pre-60S factor [Podospora aff. communis PSN243]|uniref:Pre-60S factor n=1 Tax=Podospora aff. communis PSN243 TaxID=3040156 RepID=A0AAV9GEK7_9PEZI|nr:pre-60S factor [Podospora aff. communis PSN243]
MSHDQLTATTITMTSVSAFKLSSKHCSTCNVSFDNDGVWRAHSKAPWHVENLRRRVAGLCPIDASAFQTSETTLAPQTHDEYSEDSDNDEEDASSSEDTGDDLEAAPGAAPEFAAEHCLFCNERSETFDNCVDHMRKCHGLLIKDIGNLIVDLETLVRYFHLVIFQYRECLYCHSQRRTVEAVQQHMIGKGHCKIDIESLDSEYRDFFDFGTDEPNDQTKPAGHTAQLRSGKTIISRVAGRERQIQRRSTSPTASPPKTRGTTPLEQHSGSSKDAPQTTAPSQTISRSERREAYLTDQLATLSVGDRMSLAHLSSSEQRSVLAVRKKQLDKARRVEQRYRSRLEIISNRTSQKHFVEDTRAGKLIQE